jgi:hypothetical protein
MKFSSDPVLWSAFDSGFSMVLSKKVRRVLISVVGEEPGFHGFYFSHPFPIAMWNNQRIRD